MYFLLYDQTKCPCHQYSHHVLSGPAAVSKGFQNRTGASLNVQLIIYAYILSARTHLTFGVENLIT